MTETEGQKIARRETEHHDRRDKTTPATRADLHSLIGPEVVRNDVAEAVTAAIAAWAEITPLDPTKATIVHAVFAGDNTGEFKVEIDSNDGHSAAVGVVGSNAARVVSLTLILGPGESYNLASGTTGAQGHVNVSNLIERTIG